MFITLSQRKLYFFFLWNVYVPFIIRSTLNLFFSTIRLAMILGSLLVRVCTMKCVNNNIYNSLCQKWYTCVLIRGFVKKIIKLNCPALYFVLNKCFWCNHCNNRYETHLSYSKYNSSFCYKR